MKRGRKLDVIAINELKEVAIERFNKLAKKLNKGYLPSTLNLSLLLLIIDNFNDIPNNLKYQEYLLNQE